MLLHGLLLTFTGKNKYSLVKCKHIQPIWILLYILTTQRIAQSANVRENKAVFTKPCTGIMTLSSSVPNLTQFTLCTYIKLESSNPWTAFTYKLPSSTGNVFEMGLLGDSSSIKIWMFGTQINILKSLKLHTWYELCIRWSAKTQNMALYIDGIFEEQNKLDGYTKLNGGGNVVLGCSHFDESNSTISVGLVGELYMFRMWRTDEASFLQKCTDGNVIKWDIGNWIYSPDVVQQDSALPCANQQSEISTNGQISNFIHMLHKRSANGPDILSEVTPSVQPAYNSATVPEINNTSISNVLWTSGEATNVSDVFSSSITTINERITTDNRGTTSAGKASSSSITPVNTYITTEYKNTTSGDGFSSSITTLNETITTSVNRASSSSLTPVNTYITTDYKNTNNVSDVFTSSITTINGSITTNNGDTTSVSHASSSSITPVNTNITTDFKSTSGSVSNVFSSSITTLNGNNKTDYGDTTSVSDVFTSSINTINGSITTDSGDTTSVSHASSSSITSVNMNITTDFKNTSSSGNMSCIYNVSTEVSAVYTDICNSTFSCSGRVYEVILQDNCTDAVNKVINFPWFKLIQKQITTLPTGCRILLNDTIDICWVEVYLTSFGLSLQAKNIIDYCCCDEECRQSSCFNSETVPCTGSSTGTTKGSQNIDYSNSFFSTSKKTITDGSGTNSNNITVTTVNSQPISTTKNIANTTIWHSGSVSVTSADSNTTVNSETTLIISNGSSKTTGNSGSTTAFNRTSSTTVISAPTTSFSSHSNTPHKGADFTTLDTTFSEMTNSASSTNQSLDIDKDISDMEKTLEGEVSVLESKKIMGKLNNILSTSQNLSASQSTRLIKIVDKLGLKLNFPGQSVNLTSQYLALAVNKVNASHFTETSFGVESSSDLKVTLDSQPSKNSAGSVLLPASLLNNLSSSDKDIASRVQFNYYAKTSFFTDSSLTGSQYLVSDVISASVANLTVTNLQQNVTVTLKTLSHNNSVTLKCVFWDFTKNSGNGGWSSEGCTVDSTTQNNNNNQTVCKCNHLTSFAILLDMTPNYNINPEDKLILTFITYIGCGLSAIFLSVTLVTYIAFEKIRRDYPSKILIQLCAALIGLNLTFLMDPWIALYSEIPGLCISVAAFLHYFLLVSITWMGLEAFHMYLSLVKVFNTYVRKYILKFCIIGWGAPAVVVAIILAVNKDLYELQISQPYPNGSADYFCWMKDIIYWITVVGYFCAIFLLNVSMFVVVLIQLCRIKKQKQLGYQRKTFLQDVRSVAGITFLLGITWGLGFFSFGPGKTVIQYLFTIFNSLQGFFIFFFYCVAKENVRKQWRRYLCCGKFRLAENSDWSKTATNKLKKQTSKQGVSSSSSNSIQSTSNSNSTTLLVSNEYSMHPNGNGNVVKERNGVTFLPHNEEIHLGEIADRPPTRNGDAQRTSLRRTSNRGSVHFVDQM